MNKIYVMNRVTLLFFSLLEKRAALDININDFVSINPVLTFIHSQLIHKYITVDVNKNEYKQDCHLQIVPQIRLLFPLYPT